MPGRHRGAPANRAATLVAAGVIAVVMAILLVATALRLASDPEVARSVADETFVVGEAERLAAAIERGGPLLFQDPLEQGGDGRGRDIYVEHEGDDPEEGWSAIDVETPGVGCRLELNRDTGRYLTPCPKNRRYPAEVENGLVVVDLRESEASADS